MTKVRARGEGIRQFILDHVEKHPADISRLTAKHFGITCQAVNKHLQRLAAKYALLEAGHTRNRIYKLAPLLEMFNNVIDHFMQMLM
jgi:predicted transcriptional regulator